METFALYENQAAEATSEDDDMTPDELSWVIAAHIAAVALGIPLGLSLSLGITAFLGWIGCRRQSKEPWVHLCSYSPEPIVLKDSTVISRNPPATYP